MGRHRECSQWGRLPSQVGDTSPALQNHDEWIFLNGSSDTPRSPKGPGPSRTLCSHEHRSSVLSVEAGAEEVEGLRTMGMADLSREAGGSVHSGRRARSKGESRSPFGSYPLHRRKKDQSVVLSIDGDFKSRRDLPAVPASVRIRLDGAPRQTDRTGSATDPKMRRQVRGEPAAVQHRGASRVSGGVCRGRIGKHPERSRR